MLWKTHLRISFEVLRRLDISLSDETEQSFRKGILGPDKWQDYPHHHGKSAIIDDHLMKARGYFLKDDFGNAFFHLGVALHYIQDSYTSYASFYRKHQSWEGSIENAYFTDDLEKTINYSLRNKYFERKECLRLANALSKEAQGRDNTLCLATLSGRTASKNFAKPIVDLNLGLRASYVVTKSVLSPKNCLALEKELRDVISHYAILMKNAEVELTSKVITLINERDNLKKLKRPASGILSKIRNGILGIKISLKDSAINSNYRDYVQQKHLKKVAGEYLRVAHNQVAPYVGWYTFQIPILDPNAVGKELLSVQEVGKGLGEDEHALKEAFNKYSVSCYFVGNVELVKREELDRYLGKVHANG